MTIHVHGVSFGKENTLYVSSCTIYLDFFISFSASLFNLSFACKITYVNMQHNYLKIRLVYINVQHIYVAIKQTYAQMRVTYVNYAI